MTQSSEISAEMADMDCHKKQQEQTTKHCEGVCLCDHAQNSQTPMLQGPYELTKITTSFKRITAHSETGSSLLRPPLLKPPRQRA